MDMRAYLLSSEMCPVVALYALYHVRLVDAGRMVVMVCYGSFSGSMAHLQLPHQQTTKGGPLSPALKFIAVHDLIDGR